MPEDTDDGTQEDNPTIAEIRASRDEAVGEAKQVKRENAVLRHNLGFNDRQVSALLADPDLDVNDVEAVKAAGVELGFLSEDTDEGSDEPSEEEQDAANAVTAATTGGEPPAAGVITPTDAAQWSTEKFARFQQEHPEEAEQLLRGEEVSGVTA